ncbi:SRPBCC family protein [Dyadobacter sp. CY323]|uniref:SRPBCC family protein n=1 Tax=Dyadobacter sp. CY323 TaxID=2907302 RepID=UPI001F3573B7|nr:SRPBCC family protein [Dyadobacter sp. CY323]MCE6992943.1 SRPBCC family protein [Dyadobacter sp. CY323]
METLAQKITVESTVNAPITKVWEQFNAPEHVTKWCFASDDWHAPFAENDLQTGGKFKTTMAAKDGSFSFDFGGVYSNVTPESLIEYTMEDGRTVKVVFTDHNGSTTVTEIFDAEQTHSVEMQKAGWQAILDNFKKHVEEN